LPSRARFTDFAGPVRPIRRRCALNHLPVWFDATRSVPRSDTGPSRISGDRMPRWSRSSWDTRRDRAASNSRPATRPGPLEPRPLRSEPARRRQDLERL